MGERERGREGGKAGGKKEGRKEGREEGKKEWRDRFPWDPLPKTLIQKIFTGVPEIWVSNYLPYTQMKRWPQATL